MSTYLQCVFVCVCGGGGKEEGTGKILTLVELVTARWCGETGLKSIFDMAPYSFFVTGI